MRLPDRLETERLTLRPLRASDAGAISLYAGDRRVAEMLASVPHPYPPGAAEMFIERALSGALKEQAWAMDAGKSGGAEFIGVISLKGTMPPELGYWVGPPFWRTGYATEAAKAVVEAARVAGALSLSALVRATNEGSAQVLTNIGFAEAGGAETFNVALGAMVETRRFALAFGTGGA